MDWLSKVPTWLAALALAAIAGAFVFVAVKQPDNFRFAGLDFGRVQQVDLSLDDAVIAFDRKRSSRCPKGWDLFEQASGRMIVGSGPHPENTDQNGNTLSTYPSYSDNPKEAEGGEEKVALTVEEMPRHVHGLGLIGVSGIELRDGNPKDNTVDFVWYLSGSSRLKEGLMETPNAIMKEAGKGQTHNNMPPYIALYFCKKAGS